jgi:hypothetical protein
MADSKLSAIIPLFFGALSPPPTGRDLNEDTQLELVLAEHSYEEVELKAILSFCYSCYFQHFGLYEKKTSLKNLILCVIALD